MRKWPRLGSALILLLVTVRGAFAASNQPIDAATQFVDLLATGEYARASAQCDATMRQALPEAKLRTTWEGLQRQVGRFQQRLQARAIKLGGFDVVLVTCRFENTTIDTKVVLNAKAEVSGLFFLPSTSVAESSGPPVYAHTNEFQEREITIGTGEWRLPGTLSMPATPRRSPAPGVVLVHGSGPNDRDETVGAAKPFRDLAWGLATKGIAVLRYEKRTKQYASKFTASEVIKLTVREEIIDDAVAAVERMRHTEGIDPNSIFVLGHSLGGTVAPRIAEACPQVKGLILLAGPTRPLEDLVTDQTRYLVSLKGEASPAEQEQLRALQSAADRIKKLTPADRNTSTNLLGASAAYWLDLRAHDPVNEARSLKQPILILQGGRDYQVTQADLNGWKHGLAASRNASFKLYPELNHLFIAGEGKSSPQEYEKPGHVSGVVVTDIANWIVSSNGSL